MEDIGKPRAEATVSRLAELNSYVPVRNLGSTMGEEISVDLIKGFQVSRIVVGLLPMLIVPRSLCYAGQPSASSKRSMTGLMRMALLSSQQMFMACSGADTAHIRGLGPHSHP